MTAMMEIMVGRIETLALDAVVNAANRRLQPGTGVDGALRAAAGPELTRATAEIGGVGEGEAVITPGFNLPAKHVIHTAAPVWHASADDGAKISTLTRCYASSIGLAHAYGLASIAFPCLGTGNFGWPRDIACETAIITCHAASAETNVQHIVFCCFSEADADVYRTHLQRLRL